MKYAFVALALAALAQAQTRADIPDCALPCLDDAIKKNTKCATTDYACVCENFDAVQGDATGCVLKACGTETAINKVLPATKALCAANSGPDAESSAATSAAATTAAQETSAAVSSVTVATSVASSAPSSAPVSSAPESSEVPVGTGTSKTATGTGAPSSPSSSATHLPPVSGAAAMGSIGGIAMLALGALAL